MQVSSFKVRAIAAWGMIVGLAVMSPAQAQSGRMLLSSAVTDREDHLDLTIEFACTLRYQAHSPASEGDTVRISLQPGLDCGLGLQPIFQVERQLALDDTGLVHGIELAPGLAGGAELTISWNHIEKYVLAPTGEQRGLRIRVIRQKRSGASLTVDDTPGAVGSFTINLISSLQAIDPEEKERARALLNVPIIFSDIVVNGKTWHRLRAGPFFSRGAAERVLREAQKTYSGAWLGVDDETKQEPTDENLPPPTAVRTPLARGPENRPDPALDAQLSQARKAMSAKRYDEAVMLLSKILVSPDYVHRDDAQELLGLALEREKFLARAQAEYLEYLRRYPEGKAAFRVRQRLKALRIAGLPGHRGSGGGDEGEAPWRVYGSADQTYRRDNSSVQTPTTSLNAVSQNAVISDVDVVARKRGERYDFTSRASVGYMRDLMPGNTGPGDQSRVSAAYAELRDRELGLGAKIGRQSRGMAGLFSSFDGLLGTWQARPTLGVSVAAGSPVDSSRYGVDLHREFLGASVDFGSRKNTWDISLYAIAQQYYGELDRASIGFETRYFRPGRTFVATLDYDVHFAVINNAMLLGTLLLPSNWTLSANASRQMSPVLSLRNALIGQPTNDFLTLQQDFTLAEIEQLAKDRSASLTQGSFTVSHPLGQSGQWMLTAYSIDIAGTPASGGVGAVTAFGRDNSVTSDFIFNSFFQAGDVVSVSARLEQGGGADIISMGLGDRLSLGDAWRLTSRLRADERKLMTTGTQEWLYAPSMRLDYLRKHGDIELEAGAEFGNRTTNGIVERNTRFYFSLGYRLQLDTGNR